MLAEGILDLLDHNYKVYFKKIIWAKLNSGNMLQYLLFLKFWMTKYFILVGLQGFALDFYCQFSLCLFVYIPVCLYLSVCLSVSLPVCVSVSLSLFSIPLSHISIPLSHISIPLYLTSVSLSLSLSIFIFTDKNFFAAEGADHFLLDVHFYILDVPTYLALLNVL
jgi:hypothetical protein